MYGRFDKIAPGLVAKVNFAFDAVYSVLVLLLATAAFNGNHDGRLIMLAFIGMGAWFFAAALLRLYSPCTPRTKADGIVLNVIAATGMTAALWLTQRALWPDGDSGFSAISFFVVFTAGSALIRISFLMLQHRVAPPEDEVLIVGTGPHAVKLYRQLTAGEGDRRGVVGFLRLRGQPQRLPTIDAPILGDADDLLSVLASHPVDEVYIAAQVMSYGRDMQKVVSVCEDIGMPFALPTNFLRFERASLLSGGESDGYLHYLSTKCTPSTYAIKRVVDIVASLMALLFLAPLMLGVALAIKLTSPGPVLFKQKRVGLHGATFNLFKFRSMVQNAEALRGALIDKNEQSGPVFKMKNDPRITGVGRFIRRYSIDELPQLINVLRGDMTIVGPRPALPSEVALYKMWQRRRLSVRPGLTCFWQVGGRNSIGFEEWMRLDLHYVDNWSLGVDLRLILQTVPVVLAGRGAS